MVGRGQLLSLQTAVTRPASDDDCGSGRMNSARDDGDNDIISVSVTTTAITDDIHPAPSW